MTFIASPTRAAAVSRRFAVMLSIALVTVTTGCGEQTPASPAPQAERRDPRDVRVDAALSTRVKTGALETKPFTEAVRVAGRLDVNQYRTSRVGAPITGRLTSVAAMYGQPVRQGQILAEINSPELAQAQLAFLRAHSEQQLLERAVERAQLLLGAGVIGSADLQRRQSELTVALAEKRAASDQLRQLGLSEARIGRLESTGQIQPTAAITAPLAGILIERRVAQGQVVNPADVLFVISDLSSVWALAEVPEQESRFVGLGQRVEVEIPALDNERFPGRVAYVADVVDPETRTVRVGVEMDNRTARLKPSMLMTMIVEGPTRERQLVPVGAVVRENNADHVFVRTGPEAFRLTRVNLGPERDGMRPLETALAADAEIVLDGAFHLNNVRLQQTIESNQPAQAAK